MSDYPVVAIGGLCLAAMGFVAMSPIFWTLPTEYMTGYAAAAGIGLINSLGNLGGFTGPHPARRPSRKPVAATPACTSWPSVRVLAARSCSPSPSLFKKANEIEAGHLDEVDSFAVKI